MRREVYERRKKKLISVFIAIVMISSVMGFAASYYSGDSSLEYDGHRFNQKNNQFSTKLDGNQVFFNFLPSQVSDINFSSEMRSALDTKALYVSYDENSTYASAMAIIQYSMEKSFTDEFGIFVTKGLAEENEFDLPVITCADATEFTPVVLFVESNSSEINFNDNCIEVGISANLDVYRFVARLRYALYGVMA